MGTPRQNCSEAMITHLPEAAPNLHPTMTEECSKHFQPNMFKHVPWTHGLLASPPGS